MDQADHLLALNAVSGLGPQRIRKVIEHFGSGQNVFECSEQDLAKIRFLPPDVVSQIKKFPVEEFLRQEHRSIAGCGARIITFFDEEYPSLLKEIADPPIVLYGRGDLSLFKIPAIAIVGCRHASVYGMTTAERLAQDLAQYPLSIVSGLAKGIDTAAHRGALRAQGKTIAVLGTGLKHVYPAENKKLFDVIAREGLLLSEFPMAMPPRAYHFPRRNRIVSGLSLGVIVVEAAKRSGALITADLALEQGRDVFAVPGKIDAASAQGVNDLIKQGAKLISCGQDVLDELGLAWQPQKESGSSTFSAAGIPSQNDASGPEEKVLSFLSKDPVTLDTLCQQSGLSMTQLCNILLNLELKGAVRQMPGKLFVIR